MNWVMTKHPIFLKKLNLSAQSKTRGRSQSGIVIPDLLSGTFPVCYLGKTLTSCDKLKWFFLKKDRNMQTG